MNLFQAIRGRTTARSLSLEEWAGFFGFPGGGVDFPFLSSSSITSDREDVDATFAGYVLGAYERNGIVFACITAKMLVFSEARFQFQQMRAGRPGDLFGTADLNLLETPWPNATTGDLLNRMLQDADLAGNFFATRRPPARPGGQPWLERLRPDWTTIVTGSQTGSALDAELVGYIFEPGGPGSGIDPVALDPKFVCHFAPIPDPIARFRGMSWLTPVLREIMGDGASTNHKLKYFEQGATPNTVVTLGQTNLTPEAFAKWVDQMEATHAGVANAYRTLYLAAGSDAKVIGSDMRQIDFKAVQGHGETRIAAAARIPPVIVGLSEGLDAATYSNYAQAKRAFADGTIRPLWRNAAGSLAPLVTVPAGCRLWYDDRDIPFLAEDRKDAAEIQATEATTINTLIAAGFTPDSVISAVTAADPTRLVHSGLMSVQLQAPGSASPNPADVPALPVGGSNGSSA